MTQFNSVNNVPAPEADALAQSDALVQRILQQIQQHGDGLPFDQYMSLALYEPGLGYYSAGSRKFGEDGDFVTAPEISALFSRCLANQALQAMDRLDNPVILELGAGTGVMACDILIELQRHKALPEAYWILEVSADLKRRQQELIRDRVPFFYEKVRWLEQLPTEPFNGVILANEVVDALPVKRFTRQTDALYELAVGNNDGQLGWVQLPCACPLAGKLDQLQTDLGVELPIGYVSELNINLQHWLHAVTSQLQCGIMLVLDYGYPRKEYYHPDRMDGTLLCHYRHRAHANPFFYPGLQDITTSVDFTLLAESAVQCALEVKGYTTQAYFLLANGLEALTSGIHEQDTREQTRMAQQIRLLTLPGEMGERIKVMALGRDYADGLNGFALMDQRIRL